MWTSLSAAKPLLVNGSMCFMIVLAAAAAAAEPRPTLQALLPQLERVQHPVVCPGPNCCTHCRTPLPHTPTAAITATDDVHLQSGSAHVHRCYETASELPASERSCIASPPHLIRPSNLQPLLVAALSSFSQFLFLTHRCRWLRCAAFADSTDSPLTFCTTCQTFRL